MSEPFCTATHENITDGCYGEPNHPGKHHSISFDVKDHDHPDGEWVNGNWLWGDEAPAVEPVTFTVEELAIIQTALQPVQQFFPDLMAKITAAREAQK